MSLDNKDKLFRKVSIDRLSSPEQLDQSLIVITPKSWILLLASALIAAVIILWLFYGVIPVKLSGSGIIIGKKGIYGIQHLASGMIDDLVVDNGQLVRKGDLIGIIDQPELKILLENKTGKDKKALEETYKIHSEIRTKYSGRIIEVIKTKGDYINPGDYIMRMEIIEKNEQELISLLYILARDGKKIKKDMIVELELSTVKTEENGFLFGRVDTVSEFPASQKGMERILGNKNLVDELSSMGSVVEVKVILEKNEIDNTYKWSSKNPHNIVLKSGTLCNANIIIEYKSPISMLLGR